jgi:hypothetical protein
MTSPLLTPVFTIDEYAKTLPEDSIERPIIEMFAESSDVAKVIPWVNVESLTFRGYREVALQSTMAYRPINAPSTSGGGVVAAYQESLFFIDHDIPVDRILVEGLGDRRRAIDERMSMARLGELWLNTFLKGDNTVTNAVPNGIQKRAALYGRTIDNSGGVMGGAPLSLAQLDYAIQRTGNATHIISPWAIMYRWIGAARNQTLTGFVEQTFDEVGRPKLSYAGLPILSGYKIDLHPPILPFTEVAPAGGAANCSSIYVVSFGENDLCGIQKQPMQIQDFGLLPDGITYNTHVHWGCGLVDNSLFCLTRLAGITNAPFTP